MTLSRIGQRTVLFMTAMFAVIAAVTCVLSGWEQAHGIRAEAEARGQALASSVAGGSLELILNSEVDMIQSTIDRLRDDAGLAYVLVTDGNGETIAHTFVPGVPAEIAAIAAERTPKAMQELGAGGHRYLHFAAPMLRGYAGYVHLGIDLSPLRQAYWRTFLHQQAAVLALFLLGVVAAGVFTRRISGPLETLTTHADELVERNFGSGDRGSGGGNENAARAPMQPLDPRVLARHDELGRLATSFTRMEKELQRSIAELERASGERERIASELRIAHDIQMNILPKSFPPFPDRQELDLHALLRPAREVGGDFFDFFLADSDRLFIAIGDVSGKGVPASIFMAVTTTLVRSAAWRVARPAQVLAMVNDELARDNPAAMFVTLFLGLLDLRTGRLEYANGGHNPPLLRRGDGTVIALDSHSGPLLGYEQRIDYRPFSVDLAPGELVVLYTDGITEALDSRNALFGEQRLLEAVIRRGEDTAEAIVSGVAAEVDAFAVGEPQADDLTLLALRYRGTAAGTHRIALGSRLDELGRVNELLETLGASGEIPQSEVLTLQLLLEEILVNVISHGGPTAPGELVEVLLQAGRDELRIEVSDAGAPFDPLAAAPPNTAAALEERPIGGLGIHLVKKLSSHVGYRRADGRNHLWLIRKREA